MAGIPRVFFLEITCHAQLDMGGLVWCDERVHPPPS